MAESVPERSFHVPHPKHIVIAGRTWQHDESMNIMSPFGRAICTSRSRQTDVEHRSSHPKDSQQGAQGGMGMSLLLFLTRCMLPHLVTESLALADVLRFTNLLVTLGGQNARQTLGKA